MPADTDGRPNILLVLADEHRWDCLGLAGNPDVKTPHLDALARDGVTFTNCFATFPLCTPSRYSLITGLYPHQHLGLNNQTTLPSGITTFPRILQQAGYETACVGKMHYTPTYSDVGFGTMVLAEQDGPGRFDDDYHRELQRKGLADCTDLEDQVGEYRAHAPPSYWGDFGTTPTSLPDAEYSTTWIGDRACEALAKWGDGEGGQRGGHFLMVGFIKPHHPFDTPAPWRDQYDPARLSLLPGWTEACLPHDLRFAKGHFDFTRLTPAVMREVLRQYYASITQIDHHVGRMLSLLRERDLYDRTLVIYTADHGDLLGHHHLVLKGNYMYDPVMRVPLVMRIPAAGPDALGDSTFRGNRQDLANTLDVTATILDASGCLIPQAMWAISQPLAERDAREAVFAEDGAGNYMVRTRAFKLLLCRAAESQFFDLAQDPYELHNLFKDPASQADIARLQAMLFHWLAFDSRATPHLDEQGPAIRGPNVPPRDDGHRTRAQEYFRKEMGEWRKNLGKA